MARALRFAFDIGTNSLGWAVLSGDRLARPNGPDQGAGLVLQRIEAAGVRIYSDGRNPKDGSSLAEMRRVPRGARRRRDRFKQRQRRLLHELSRHELWPQDAAERRALDTLDPYALRARGLDERLTPSELGRVLFHLNQRRGFKSNRKTDGAQRKENSLMKAAAARLESAVRDSGARTLGELLHRRLAAGEGARFRPSDDPKVKFEFYPTRALIEAEFVALWAAQATHHPRLVTESARAAIRNAIFDQRRLKPVKAGRCTFLPEQERAPAALPSVQARVIYETLNALRYGEGLRRDAALSKEQRDLFASDLLAGTDRTFDAMRRTLKLGESVRFNFEDVRSKIDGAATAKKLGHKNAFGRTWRLFDLAKQNAIVEMLLEEEDEETAVATLMAEYGLNEPRARYVASVPLPEGYARLGRTANARVLEELRKDVVVYSVACERAGFHHSDFRDGVIHARLPYYGAALERHVAFGLDPEEIARKGLKGRAKEEAEKGRIANPTVHIGLNQLRRVANKLIERYGQPDEIVVELGRDLKQSLEEKKRRQNENKANRDKNDARKKRLGELGIPENAENMFRMRLWEEQHADGIARCPYSLRKIEIGQLFTGEVDVDHILPVSKTLDDSPANKVVCFRSANRGKRNRSPFEAFGEGATWPDIEANAVKLPRNKAWRFRPDAMDAFSKQGDFLDRQLNETRYLARIAKAYLGLLTPNVWVVTGRLTALLRGKWGLNRILGDDNRKNRDDHRHHAIDAIVIGCTSRSLLNEVARRAGQAEEQNLDKLFGNFPEPMPDFLDQARAVVRRILVSHKPEHGRGGALHEDTAYGIVRNEADRAIGNLVYRRALADLTLKDAERVRDPRLRERFLALREAASGDEKAFRAALKAWAKEDAEAIAARTGTPRQPMRHVRLLKPEKSAVPIADRRTGESYKALVPGKNWCVDVVQMRDGSWKGYAASIFEASKKDWRPQWERERVGGKLVMRLHKGDLIEIDEKEGGRAIKRVVRINPASNRLWLAGHNEGGILQDRGDEDDDSFEWDRASFAKLRERSARKVRIDEIGNPIP